MAKRAHEDGRRWRLLLLPLAVGCSFVGAYLCISPFFQTSFLAWSPSSTELAEQSRHEEAGGCCRGAQHTELWSEAVNWGSDFLVNSTQECCDACKGNPKCNSWVYCAEPAKCGSFYRQCWLKRQKDPLNPEVHDSSSSNPWTSGLLFNKDEGMVELAIDSGALKGQVIPMKLLSDFSPQSVLHVLELLKLPNCQGCRFYRAEGRGKMWDSSGKHLSKMRMGPPYAVLQGTLKAHHDSFQRIPSEYVPAVKRGMVGWVDGGPDFFISLADHSEWPRKHTVFATVDEGDMQLVEKIAALPTAATTWGNVAVEALEAPVNVKVQRRAQKA